MTPSQPTAFWAEARRLFGFLRLLLARLFPGSAQAAVIALAPRPAPAPVSTSDDRTDFVTLPEPLPDTTPDTTPDTSLDTSPDTGPDPQAELDADDSLTEATAPRLLAEPLALPLLSALESLLFVADEAVEPVRLAQALGCGLAEVNGALAQLRSEYEQHNRGVRLQERNGKAQLVTNPAAAQAVEDFLSLDLTTKLSGPALETLAIIAYRQPVTRVQIEAVRGVDCSGMVRKLEQQGLVEEVGRLETPGRPILYGVTDLFLQHFGLTHLAELPALPELDADSLRAVMALAEE